MRPFSYKATNTSRTAFDKETDLTMTLSIVIDQETYLMEDFSLIIDVEHEQGNMNFDIRSLFTNINQISEIDTILFNFQNKLIIHTYNKV